MAKRVKVEIEDESNKDNVTYKKKVVVSIVSLATQEINGIASMSRNSVRNVNLPKKNSSRGIQVEFNEEKVIIDVFVNVKFGYSVKDVAFRVQENVKNSVESMTDFKVSGVNVHVVGVTFSEEGSDFVQ